MQKAVYRFGRITIFRGSNMTEWNAPEYARIAGLQEAMAAEALALLELRGDEYVLDLGCGNGKVTAQIAERLPDGSVVGVDASADMVAFASAHYAQANLRFESCDIRDIQFRDDFDLVVSFNALHWIPQQEVALRAVREAMKPSAVAQLRLVPKGERKSLEDVLEESRKSPRWVEHYKGFRDPYLHLTPEEYAAMAERVGLAVQRVHTEDKAWDFQSQQGFAAFGSVTFVEWSKRLPEVERPAFVEDVLERYRREVAQETGEENTFKFYQMDITLARNK
jgi:trans-aconitate 2-methyltransferase